MTENNAPGTPPSGHAFEADQSMTPSAHLDGHTTAEARSPLVFSWFSNWGAWILLVLVALPIIVGTVRTADGFAPDSQYYVAMAYHFAGFSRDDATQKVQHQAELRDWPLLDSETLFGWDLVEPRILYPLLSAPFVSLFGLRGMYAIPALSMMFLILGTYAAIRRRTSASAALVPLLLLCSSYYMLFFGSAMLTEALASALGAGILLTLPLDQRRSWPAVVVCGALVLAMAFTRQAAIIPAGGIAVAWLGQSVAVRSVRNDWLRFAVVSSGVAVTAQILQTVYWPSFSIFTYYMAKTGSTTLTEAVFAAPGVIQRILQADITNYFANDRALLVLLILCFIAIVVRWRHVDGQLALGAIGMAAILNILNTTPTVFRYFMPALSFVVFAVGALIHSATVASHHRRTPQFGWTSRGDEEHRQDQTIA